MTEDLVRTKQTVGKNVYYGGTVVPDRSADDSLARSERRQHPVPPNSLIWKYFGDARIPMATTFRTAVIENMHPQLGQGVSDHSVLFGGKGTFLERVRRSAKPIQSVIYEDPNNAKKFALQVRNFHKNIKGDMPNGRTYHAINSETYYWAHVTFFEMIFCASDLGVLPRPLSRDEKAQIFEESKEWFSMYGVDDYAQPATYDDFEKYLADVFENQLVKNRMSEVSTMLAERSFSNKKISDDIGKIQGVSPWVARYLIRPLLPAFGAYIRLTTLGSMGPRLRELGSATWTDKDEKNFRRIVRALRMINKITDRLPYWLYYTPEARAGFKREGLKPRDITVQSARSALAAARASRRST